MKIGIPYLMMRLRMVKAEMTAAASKSQDVELCEDTKARVINIVNMIEVTLNKEW